MSVLTPYIARLDQILFSKNKLSEKNNRRFLDFGDKKNNKTALISYLSDSFFDKKKVKYFNPYGVVLEFANVLNELGYKVDIINLWDREFIVKKDYDLFIGHCNINFKYISNQLPKKTKKILYVNVSSHEYFLEQSKIRYNRLFKLNKLDSNTKIIRKPFLDDDTIKESDQIITLGKANLNTFKRIYRKKIKYLNNAVYKEEAIIKNNQILEKGRNNFIYLSGSGANIQKGADLIIEAFAKMPNKNLFIFCELDNEILMSYKNELKLPNIKYVYQYRFSKFLKNSLFKKICFQIGVGILSGQGTAFIGGMQSGFIPIMTKEMNFEIFDNKILIKEESVESIIDTVKCLKKLKNSELNILYNKTLSLQKEQHSIEIFKTNFRNLIKNN